MAQLQTLSNALDILTMLGKSEHLLSVEEIAKELELPESTTYRLLQTLEAKDFIERHSRKQIGLGSNFINLARNLYERLDRELILVSESYLKWVSKMTKETAILSVRAGLESKCIKSASSSYIIRFVPEENRLLRLDIGASSRVILAFEEIKVIQKVLALLETKQEKEELINDLEKIKKQGYAISNSQYDLSAVGIGTPIFNTFGKIYASLAIVGPDSRILVKDYDRHIAVLKEAAQEITKKLALTDKGE